MRATVLQLSSTIDKGARPLAFLSSASSGGAFQQWFSVRGLIKSGLPVTDLHDRAFFTGRKPV
jgi:hypothetical protein